MRRRDLCKLMAIAAGLRVALPARLVSSLRESGDRASQPERDRPAKSNYANNRAPLRSSSYVRLPLGSIRPAGWLSDQFHVQVNGLTSHIGNLWDVLKVSAWKGDAGRNVTPECCTPRFVPRWLEGLTVLSGVLGDDHLRAMTVPYMEFILNAQHPESITPSSCAWSHLGRFLPDYYELTGDKRTITLVRKILDYAASVHNMNEVAVVDTERLGMLLSFGYCITTRRVMPTFPHCLSTAPNPASTTGRIASSRSRRTQSISYIFLT